MHNPDQRQYILKNSLGVSYHVYFEQGRGLCIRMLSDSRIWSRGYVIDKSATNDFSVMLDKNDIFHFFFQTQDGRLMYGHGMHGQIKIQPILSSKDPTPWPKHVCLLLLEKTVLFFYVIKYKNRFLISMQFIREGVLSKPVAIDYVEGPNYLSLLDKDGKCHLFYVGYDKEQMNLYHRVLKDDFSTFGLPEKIFSAKQNIRSLSGVCTGSNKIHIAFEVFSDDFCNIMYKNLSEDAKPASLYEGKTVPGHSGLVYNNGVIYLFRMLNGNIYFRSSENNGTAWFNDELYPLGSNVILFSYITNYSKEEDFFSTAVPGNFSRGYQLAFLNEVRVKPVEERKVVKNQESSEFNDIKKKVLLLQNLTDNMQRELTKLWLTQKSFEKQLDFLSRSYKDLQNQITYQPTEDYNEEPPPEFLDEEVEITQTGEDNQNI